jgi:hypothetical protein
VINELHVHTQDSGPVQVAYLAFCLSIFAMVAGCFWAFKNPFVGVLVCVTAILVFTLVGIFSLRHVEKVSEGSFLKVLNTRKS